MISRKNHSPIIEWESMSDALDLMSPNITPLEATEQVIQGSKQRYTPKYDYLSDK